MVDPPARRAGGRGRAAAGRPQRRPRRRRGRPRARRRAAVDGVAFTGSAEAGHAIAHTLHARPPLRPLIAEMGGKNPAIVTARRRPRPRRRRASSARPTACRARSAARARAWWSTASCTTRWSSGSPPARASSCVGDPADPATSLGPVVGAPAIERFEAAAADARRDGTIVARRRAHRRLRRPDARHRPPARPSADPRGAVPAVPHRHRRRLARRRARRGQRRRVRAHRRDLQRGPGRARGVPGADRGRRRVRQPPRGRDHRRVAGVPVLLRLEVQRRLRQGRPRAALPAAVHARAEPDGDGGA